MCNAPSVRTMRFGSTAKVLLKCKLKYYRISECVRPFPPVVPHRRPRPLGKKQSAGRLASTDVSAAELSACADGQASPVTQENCSRIPGYDHMGRANVLPHMRIAWEASRGLESPGMAICQHLYLQQDFVMCMSAQRHQPPCWRDGHHLIPVQSNPSSPAPLQFLPVKTALPCRGQARPSLYQGGGGMPSSIWI